MIGLTPYTQTRDYKQYSAIADLHTLQFTAANTSVLSLLQSPLSVSWQRDFNTGTVTVSLSYKLQISRYCRTHKVFSSQPDFQLHRTALNNSDASIPQFNSLCFQALLRTRWRLETQLTQTIFFLLFITLWHGPHRKQAVLFLRECSTGTCLLSCSIATAVCVTSRIVAVHVLLRPTIT
jgi:hypothetical protein